MTARVTAVLAAVLLGSLLSCAGASAELYAPRAGFVPDDVVTEGWFGAGAAISADGQTAVVGAPFADDGRVLFLKREDSGWLQQGPAFAPSHTGDARIGLSVAVSGDGNTAVVGAPGDADYHGSAWILTRSNGVWSQAGPALLPADPQPQPININFGYSVDISSDGSTVAISSYGDDYGYGAVRIYVRSGNSWMQQGLKLRPSSEILNPDNSYSWFGSSVALSANGSTLLAGAENDNSGRGAAWAFIRNGSTWSQQGGKLTPMDGSGAGRFGQSLALSASGDQALIGAPADAGGLGAVWSFARSAATWAQQGAKLTPVNTGAAAPDFGRSVALDASGTTALVGSAGSYYTSSGNADGGVVRLSRTGSSWAPAGAQLEPRDENGRFGSVVDLSADGTSALITAPSNNYADGMTWLYVEGTAPSVFPTMWSTVTRQVDGSTWEIWSAVGETADVVTGSLTVRIYRIRPEDFSIDDSEGCSGTPLSVLRGKVGTDNPHSFTSTLTLPGLGLYGATATFSGDPQNLPATTFCDGFSYRRPTTVSAIVTGDLAVGSHVKLTPKLAGALTPTGNMHLQIYATPATCDAPSAMYTFDASQPFPSVDFVPKNPGTLWYELRYDGDDDDAAAAMGCEDRTPAFQIDRAQPALHLAPGASTTVGGAPSADVQFTGGAAPSGSVRVELHGPDDATCQGVPLSVIEAPIGDGHHIATERFVTSRIGIYRFIASYAGDPRNHAAGTDCAAGAVTVGRRQPRLLANPSVGTRNDDAVLSTTVTVTDGFQPSGNVQIGVYGPNNRTCREPAAFTATAPLVDSVATLPSLEGADPGRYDFVATYPGDTANEAARLECGASSAMIPNRARTAPRLRITRAKVTKSSVAVKVACDAAASQKCITDVVLSARATRRRGKIVSLAKGRRVVIGRKSLTIKGGAARATTVKLNKTGRSLLKRFSRVPATVTALTDDAHATKQVTFRRKKR